MTLEEKVAQIVGWWKSDERALMKEGDIFTREFYEKIAPHGLGEIGATNMTIEDDLRQHAVVQDYFLNHTRLGIPTMRHGEAAHGLMRLEATSFPAPIGLSCSWNPELVEKLYDHSGREARSRGVLHLLSPIVDVVRELRWGRVDETLGEDPYLVSRMGAAMVRGLQGSADGTIAPSHAAATLKHFAGYGASEGGRNRAPYPNGKRLLLDTEIEVFRHVIAASKPASVMPGFNEIEGVPCHVNDWLLTDVLRDQLGFEGLVTADFNGIQRVRLYQKIGADDADAARMAIEAGLQLELPVPWGYIHLEKLVEEGKVDIALVDKAVRAVLELKFRLGLFEHPPLDIEAAKALPSSPQATELAREAARQSIVLLKNDGGLLPLDPAAHKRIAVIGPNSDVCRLGSYSGSPTKTVSLLEGIRDHLGDAVQVTHAKGCIIAKNDTGDSYENWRYENDADFPTPEENQPLIDEAVKIAEASDLVFLALGENAFLAREAWADNHLGDRTTLNLTEGQQALARAILATGKPVVLYLMHGKPISEGGLFEKFPAIVTGHYAGQETGTAAAEILFGKVNPSGKLTVSWPRNVGQLPLHYNRHASSNIFNYVDSPLTPLFPFGHGLSYTTFKYGELKLSAKAISAGGTVEASVELTNSGKRPGTEIVQLYVAGENFPVARPQLELKGFSRVTLEPGEKKRVTLKLDAEDLHFHNSDLQRVLPAGRYLVSIGGSSNSRSKEIPLRVSPKDE
jgi:beta-glucosidase